MENRQNLLGLYIGLIERLEVAPKQISRWRANGTLIEEIKAAFSKLPEGSRGGYYPWFLQNQWVLDDALTAQGDPVDEMMRGSWRYVHGPNSDTRQDIIAAMSSWSQNKKDCHMLCTLLLSDMHPAPHLPIWVNFGFCVCSDETDEGSLSSLYRQLMAKCTFDEIYAAYECSSLIALFDAKGLKPAREKICNLEDVLRGSPRNFKSVWHLKRIVTMEDGKFIPSILVDYGFINCRTEEEWLKLREVYRRIFRHYQADPVQLHEAAMGGRLFEYAKELVKLKKKDKKTIQRLMSNPYPLPIF
jgi:hypothetical protein